MNTAFILDFEKETLFSDTKQTIMYINKAIIAGNVTRDPELKSLPSGIKITTFSIATNRFWKDATTGERKEMAEYHNVVVSDAKLKHVHNM